MEKLRINQLMDIVLENESFREYYPVRIEDIDENFIYIGMPMKHGNIVRIQKGQEIQCVFRNINKYYGFSTIINDIIKKPIPILIADKPVQLKEVNQKRAYVRLQVALPIQYRLLDENDELEEQKEDFYDGQTVNISAGGILFSTGIRLETQQQIKIILHIPNHDPISCKARVLRVFDKVDYTRKTIWVAIQYIDIHDSKRDKIFNYIFEKERELIRLGYKL